MLVNEDFKKSFQAEIKLIINPLTAELNPFAQRCLTSFLLGILLL
jgi:hypothetical protein